MRGQHKWRRRLLWVTGSLVGLLLATWLGMVALMHLWVAKPPPLPVNTAITELTPESRDGRVYLGQSWFGKVEGLPVLYLKGTPFEMGYANGALTQKYVERQEETVLGLFHRVAPYRWTQFLLKFIVVYKNRHLPEHITADQQLEILGLSLGCRDPHPEVGPFYFRLLNYHAAQDISYMLMNSPLIRRGCTAFGAWGDRTRDGHLLAGRNFDWEADPIFDEDRILIICEPANGIPFISLAWAGMAGCVSGMNREGLSVTVNGAPSHLPGDAATPTCLVAREVLQHARTIEEAKAIIQKRQVFVSALFLVGSRKDGRFVVIEKTPDTMAVREPGDEPWIVCANHYLTDALKDDPLNEEFKRVDTSVARYDRLRELIEGTSRPVDAAQCAAFLRDRRLPCGAFPGNGHRSTLNPLIATHSVVMELTAGVFWASLPPHQLGRFVAFDLSAPGTVLPEQAVAEDPILASGEFERYRVATAALEAGRQALARGDIESAATQARTAETNNPGFYRNSWLLAEALSRQGKFSAAATACQAALAGKPALAGERKQIEALAAKLAAAPVKAP